MLFKENISTYVGNLHNPALQKSILGHFKRFQLNYLLVSYSTWTTFFLMNSQSLSPQIFFISAGLIKENSRGWATNLGDELFDIHGDEGWATKL